MVAKLHVNDIRKMTDEQILDAIEDTHQEMWELRLNKATGELENVNLIKLNRRNLARLKTVLRERQLAAELAVASSTEEGSNNA